MTNLNIEDLARLDLLLSIDGIGPGKVRNLLSKFHSLEKIFSANYNTLLEVDGISNNLAQRIHQSCKLLLTKITETKIELEKLDKLNASIITVWDKEYPPILKKIYDPPLILFIKGKLIETDNFSISMVGTRQPTNYGKIQAERLAADLSNQNITIISGLARGIDSISHSAVLKNNGRTIAIVGSGLDVIYPPENKKLFEAISEQGAVISEFKLGTKPDAQNFPRRNRIISGMSLGCIVVETRIEGGAMQTAAFALDQDREVFAVPGNLGVKQSEGTNYLIQKGEAKLIRSAEDVLIELELKLKPVLGKNIPKQQIGLSLFEEKIFGVLSNEPLQIDKIASSTNLSTSDCLVHLLSLEFKGLVKQLPGKMFAIL
ncbi:MAG: DNA-processing protein DprA [Bacteroidetes bacterium]|nr:DNA-processing protein DprA [Bacteroidota bacterium]